jgi:hypothetical protein
MRIFRIVNAIPNDHSNETNFDAEPSIAVNPANPHEMIITAFTPTEGGNPNGPLLFSSDGGETWGFKFDIPGGMPLDQSPCFARASNELYLGALRGDNQDLNVLRTGDPSSGTASIAESRPPVDQPWVEATTVIGGPDNGKDRVYVGYNGDGARSATVDVCLDALAANPVFNQVQLDPRNPNPNDGYEIRPAIQNDGTVYIAYLSRSSFVGSDSVADIVVARDDNWGSNNPPFAALTDPGDGKAGKLVATNVPISEGTIGGVRLNNDFNIAVDPTNSSTVYIVWCDNAGPNYTLRVRRSLNRGVDWSGDLLTADNATLATMIINSQGTVGLLYQQLVAGNMETHFRTTSDGTNWDDMLLARTATSPSFAGDYARLFSVGPHFYGVFPAMNTPDPANFFPNGGGSFRFQRNTQGNQLIGTDGVAVIAPSLDPFFFKVEEKNVTFILNRNPIGQDEVDARRLQPRNTPGGLPMPDVFRVAVDGFTAAELGIAGAGSTLNVASPLGGMTITCTGNFSENGDYGTEIQLFTFLYNIDFPDDSAFTPGGDVTLNVTAGTVPASAVLTLIKQPDPFLLHGDPAWLSIDLRLFVVRPNDTWFGVTMGSNAAAAPGFIQQVTQALTAGQGSAGGQTFDSLSPDEQQSKLYLQPNDENNTPVFNFVLAKVHYIGLIGAMNVRMFFRLRQTQVTYAPYDYPPGAQYRRTTPPPGGQPIALAGIENGEYVTVPCFALPRIDSTTVAMDQQTDSPNVQTITAHGDGSEVDTFFGCWVDINQPDLRLPVDVPPLQDGPFNINDPNVNFRPVPLKAALARNLHLCVIAEIDFDPTPIPLGKDPSNWDKLAQRNIVWSDAGSAQSVTTFEIRPTSMALQAKQKPDELMIDWNNLPPGVTAQIYIPAVNVETILGMADRMYSSHRLTRFDAHTLQCKTGGISYIPIPAGAGSSYAGLLTVDLPGKLPRGEVYNVVVRQLTNAFGKATPPPPPPPSIGIRRAVAAVVARGEVEWRRVIGAFQLTIPVRNKELLLVREERDLSVLRWISGFIPHHSRWYPVFHRYLSQIAGRVSTFGGDPSQILPSPTGDGRHKHRRHPEPEGEERRAFTGKIAGLIFDGFGDFEGFLLDTEDGERKFLSREKEIEELAERAWRDRLRITVWVERDEPHRPLSIIIRQPPAPFWH